MKVEEQRKEIMYCLIEQDFFNFESYEEGIKKLKLELHPIVFYIADKIIHEQIVYFLDEIIEDLKEKEE